MALSIDVRCVCGAITQQIDWRDATMEGFSMTCSDACRAIEATREAWAKEFEGATV